MKESKLQYQLDPEHPQYSEEREGLLSDKDHYNKDDEDSAEQDVSRWKIYVLAGVLSVLLLSAVFVPPLLRRGRRPVADFDSQKLRLNGTHTFRKTALIVSIDGLR